MWRVLDHSGLDLAVLVFSEEMPAKLHGAGLWAQVTLKDAGISQQRNKVCFWQFGQKHAYEVISLSSGHATQVADTGAAAGLESFYCPVQFSSY